MKVEILPDGKLRIPVRVVYENIIGDATKIIDESDPDYDVWYKIAIEQIEE